MLSQNFTKRGLERGGCELLGWGQMSGSTRGAEACDSARPVARLGRGESGNSDFGA